MKTSFPSASVAFDNVTATRGEKTLFTNLTFSLAPGQLVWVQGSNGVGKTTLLRIAAGLSPPAEGLVSRTHEREACRAEDITAYQGHNNALKRQISVSEDISFWSKIYGFSGGKTAVLDQVDLTKQADIKCAALSAGQGRRLAIARLLISRKPFWIMDEPAAAMDIEGQTLISSVIESHLGRGGIVMAASHDAAKRFRAPTSVLTLEAV